MPGRVRLRWLALLLLFLPLAACTGSGAQDDAPDGDAATDLPTEASPSAGGSAATGELAGVAVTGRPGAEPTVRVDEPYAVDETTVQVLAGR